ncbi:MAG: glutathionylspermidine synthase family protein [Patescibacteria group bacterium]
MSMIHKNSSLAASLNDPTKAEKLDEWTAQYYASLPGGLRQSLETRDGNPYILWDTVEVTQQMADAIRLAGTNIHKAIRAGIGALMQSNELLYNEYNMPEEYLALGLGDNVPLGDMRIDLSVDAQAYYDAITHGKDVLPHHIRAIEWNAETPSFMWESGSGGNLIAEALGKVSPNLVGKDWTREMGRDFAAYVDAVASSRGLDLKKTPLFFSYPGDEANDFVHEDNLSFYERIAQYESATGNPVRFRYFQDLILDADEQMEGMLDAQDGERVQLLFSHFPYEMLVQEEGEIVMSDFPELIGTGINPARYWDYLVKAILDKTVTKVPGTQAAYAQNKAFYAFLWESMKAGNWDPSPEIKEIIQTHLLPTYCTPEEAHANGDWLGQVYFEKPVYGREGAGIYAYRVDSENPEKFEMILDTYKDQSEEMNQWYETQDAIYQQEGSLPVVQYLDGQLTLMFTIYVSATGQGCLLGCRAHASEELTAINPESGIWVPLSIKE